MAFIDEQITKIKGSSTRIVYPEGTDLNILRGVARVVEIGFARPILIGERDKVEAAAADAGVSLEGIEVVSALEPERRERYAEIFAEQSGLPPVAASLMLKKPLYFGAMMVQAGDADCIAAGIATETDEVVATYNLIIGMAKGVETPSCFSIQEAPAYNGPHGHLVAFSDTAINIAPTSEELADIAISSARSVRAILGWEPRIAMLSFSTCGSASHERAALVSRAVKIAREREPDLMVDGEFQLDAAIIPEVAARKVKRPSEVAGRANVLVFPNLDASNIGVKLLQRLGGAKPNGGMLQGFAKPVSDMSRGAGAEDVLRVSVMLTRLFQSGVNQ